MTGDEYYGGKIRDVFYSLINMILIECVSEIKYYEFLGEFLKEYYLIKDNVDYVRSIENDAESDSGLSIPLMKKLHKLDVHTANKLAVGLTIYTDGLLRELDDIKKKVYNNPELLKNYEQEKKKRDQEWERTITEMMSKKK